MIILTDVTVGTTSAPFVSSGFRVFFSDNSPTIPGDLLIKSGGTFRASNSVVVCRNFGEEGSDTASGGTCILKNTQLIVSLTKNIPSLATRLVFTDVQVSMESVDYRVLGYWNSSNPGQPYIFNNVQFYGGVEETSAKVGLNLYLGALDEGSVLNNLSFWNGRLLGDGCAGAILQGGGHLTYNKSVFAPIGTILNNNAGEDHRMLARFAIQGLTGVSSYMSRQGWVIEPDMRAFSYINDTHTTGDVIPYIDVDADTNMIFINPLFGRVRGANMTKFITVFFSSGSGRGGAVKVAVATNPKCSDNNVRYTFPITYDSAKFILPQTYDTSVGFNSYISDRVITNPSRGFCLVTQDYDNTTPSYSVGNYGSAYTEGEEVAPLPATLTYRQYSFLQQATESEFGREITITPPREFDTFEEDGSTVQTLEAHNAEVLESRMQGFDEVDGSEFRTETNTNTAVDPIIASQRLLTPISFVSTSTITANISSSRLVAEAKSYAFARVTHTNINDSNDKIQLGYTFSASEKKVSFTPTITFLAPLSPGESLNTTSGDASTSLDFLYRDIIQSAEVETISASEISLLHSWDSAATNKVNLETTTSLTLSTDPRIYTNLTIKSPNILNILQGHTITGLVLEGNTSLQLIPTSTVTGQTIHINEFLGSDHQISSTNTTTLTSTTAMTIVVEDESLYHAGAGITLREIKRITLDLPVGSTFKATYNTVGITGTRTYPYTTTTENPTIIELPPDTTVSLKYKIPNKKPNRISFSTETDPRPLLPASDQQVTLASNTNTERAIDTISVTGTNTLLITVSNTIVSNPELTTLAVAEWAVVFDFIQGTEAYFNLLSDTSLAVDAIDINTVGQIQFNSSLNISFDLDINLEQHVFLFCYFFIASTVTLETPSNQHSYQVALPNRGRSPGTNDVDAMTGALTLAVINELQNKSVLEAGVQPGTLRLTAGSVSQIPDNTSTITDIKSTVDTVSRHTLEALGILQGLPLDFVRESYNTVLNIDTSDGTLGTNPTVPNSVVTSVARSSSLFDVLFVSSTASFDGSQLFTMTGRMVQTIPISTQNSLFLFMEVNLSPNQLPTTRENIEGYISVTLTDSVNPSNTREFLSSRVLRSEAPYSVYSPILLHLPQETSRSSAFSFNSMSIRVGASSTSQSQTRMKIRNIRVIEQSEREIDPEVLDGSYLKNILTVLDGNVSLFEEDAVTEATPETAMVAITYSLEDGTAVYRTVVGVDALGNRVLLKDAHSLIRVGNI